MVIEIYCFKTPLHHGPVYQVIIDDEIQEDADGTLFLPGPEAARKLKKLTQGRFDHSISLVTMARNYGYAAVRIADRTPCSDFQPPHPHLPLDHPLNDPWTPLVK